MRNSYYFSQEYIGGGALPSWLLGGRLPLACPVLLVAPSGLVGRRPRAPPPPPPPRRSGVARSSAGVSGNTLMS